MRWLKFLRKEPSYLERLRRIETELVNTEHNLKSILYNKRRFFGYACIVTCLTFACIFVYAYFLLLPPKPGDLFLWLLVAAFCMIFLYLLKVMLSWYFNQRVEWYQLRLETLKQQRKDLLQEVREKETYHVAKALIDRFDPEARTNREREESHHVSESRPKTPDGDSPEDETGNLSQTLHSAAKELSQRRPMHTLTQCATNAGLIDSSVAAPDCSGGPLAQSLSHHPSFLTPESLSANFKQRTVLDKIVDYFLGDGPNNRYALICSVCCGHNGTVPKGQRDTTAFRCCYCSAFNPAPKLAEQNLESQGFGLFQDCSTQTECRECTAVTDAG